MAQLVFICIVAAMGIVLVGGITFIAFPHLPKIKSKKDLTNKKK